MKAEILHTISYFHFFNYPPTAEEIYIYLRVKVSFEKLRQALDKLTQARKIRSKYIGNSLRYTIQGYSIYFQNYIDRKAQSIDKLQRIKFFAWTLSLVPQIYFVGVSGSVAMNNAMEGDDVDIFIITAPYRLWTGRFLVLILAELCGQHRRRDERNTKNKMCFNLFFDGANLLVPESKQTEYGAHEALQLKPLINKHNAHELFILKNGWIFDAFPNAFDVVRRGKKSAIIKQRLKGFRKTRIGDLFERLLKVMQKIYIKKHQSTELITQTQLWFHPDDFEKKIKLRRRG